MAVDLHQLVEDRVDLFGAVHQFGIEQLLHGLKLVVVRQLDQLALQLPVVAQQRAVLLVGKALLGAADELQVLGPGFFDLLVALVDGIQGLLLGLGFAVEQQPVGLDPLAQAELGEFIDALDARDGVLAHALGG